MKVIVKNLQKKIPIVAPVLRKLKYAGIKALALEGINGPGEITVCLVDNKQIKEFNLLYLGRDNPTDVIAFNTGKSGGLIADIVVSTQAAIKAARIFKTTPLYELCLYAVHGLLHIIGYDDKTKREKQIMDKKSRQILTASHIRQ